MWNLKLLEVHEEQNPKMSLHEKSIKNSIFYEKKVGAPSF